MPAARARGSRGRGVRRLADRARRVGGARTGTAGEPLPAAISVGTNPTFDGERERRVEAYVLDRTDLELYDELVEISFVARIRGMVKFDGVDALVETMAQDVVPHPRAAGAALTHDTSWSRARGPEADQWFVRPRAAVVRARARAEARTAHCTASAPLAGLAVIAVVGPRRSASSWPWSPTSSACAPATMVTLIGLAALPLRRPDALGAWPIVEVGGRVARCAACGCCSRWSPGRCRCCCCS